jgi:hypothetical protein
MPDLAANEKEMIKNMMRARYDAGYNGPFCKHPGAGVQNGLGSSSQDDVRANGVVTKLDDQMPGGKLPGNIPRKEECYGISHSEYHSELVRYVCAHSYVL